MEVTKCISERRSIRKFKDDVVENEKLVQILDSARFAPSAKNRQPWKFFIAQGEIKNQIVDILKKWFENNKSHTGVLGTINAISHAPILILVFRYSDSPWERCDALSIGGAIENMLLTATSLGLGSLWIADVLHIKREIETLVSTDLDLYSAVAIGYSDENPSQRPRKTLDEILLK